MTYNLYFLTFNCLKFHAINRNFVYKKMDVLSKKILSDRGEFNVFRLINSHGCEVGLSSVGAGITSVKVPDKYGQMADVVLGYAVPTDYFYDSACAGKTPGRYANRIARGRFTIDGHEYQLEINNPPNALHGGNNGFGNVIWHAEEKEAGVRFFYHAKDGEEGYPGAMDVTVDYEWNDDNELTIKYVATADRPTIVNLTNHAYFNLAGENSGSCLGQKLMMNCHRWLPADETDIPFGYIENVGGTPMDFLYAKTLGRDIGADFGNMRAGKGYNHFFFVDGWKNDGRLRLIAVLDDDASGRRLSVYSTQCGAMLYTGNWLADNLPISKSGRKYDDYDGVAIECQGAPDAPNHPSLPCQVLRPGETYRHFIKYVFSVN